MSSPPALINNCCNYESPDLIVLALHSYTGNHCNITCFTRFIFLQRWEIKNCWALLCLPVSLKTFISGGSSHQHDILQRINSCLFGHFCNLCIQTKIRKLWMFLYWKSRKINWCASSKTYVKAVKQANYAFSTVASCYRLIVFTDSFFI